LQFNRLKDIRISGTLSNASSLKSDGAIQESPVNEGEEEFKSYRISFESAQIDVSAADYVSWLVGNQRLPPEDERLLTKVSAKRLNMGTDKQRKSKRGAAKTKKKA
jgi:hypothetical protein